MSVGPGYLKFSLAWRGANKLLHKGGRRHVRQEGKVFGLSEVLEILAPLDEGVIFEELLDAEVV